MTRLSSVVSLTKEEEPSGESMLEIEPTENIEEEDGKINTAESRVDQPTQHIRLPQVPSFSEFVNRRKMKHNTSLDKSSQGFDDEKPSKIMKLH